jgi:hypothetical protein
VIVGFSGTVTIRDISVGGLALVSSLPLRRDAVHEMQLTLGKLAVTVQAKAVHCRRQNDGRWLLGIAFQPSRQKGPTIEQLIDAVTTTTISFS